LAGTAEPVKINRNKAEDFLRLGHDSHTGCMRLEFSPASGVCLSPDIFGVQALNTSSDDALGSLRWRVFCDNYNGGSMGIVHDELLFFVFLLRNFLLYNYATNTPKIKHRY
jgi:hypothetical protein